jgi:hypothetical protein
MNCRVAADLNIRRRIQKFPDWPPGKRTANGTALCHYHNPFCSFSKSVYCCCCLFRCRLSPETFGYTLADKTSVSRNQWLANSSTVDLLLRRLITSNKRQRITDIGLYADKMQLLADTYGARLRILKFKRNFATP